MPTLVTLRNTLRVAVRKCINRNMPDSTVVAEIPDSQICEAAGGPAASWGPSCQLGQLAGEGDFYNTNEITDETFYNTGKKVMSSFRRI